MNMKKLNLLKKVSSILMLMVFIFAVAPIAFAEGYSCTISEKWDPNDEGSCCGLIPPKTFIKYSINDDIIFHYSYVDSVETPKIIKSKIKKLSDLKFEVEIRDGGKYANITIFNQTFKLNSWFNEPEINVQETLKYNSKETLDIFTMSKANFSNPNNLVIYNDEEKDPVVTAIIIASSDDSYSVFTKNKDNIFYYLASYTEKTTERFYLFCRKVGPYKSDFNPRTRKEHVEYVGYTLILEDRPLIFEKISEETILYDKYIISGDKLIPYYLMLPLVVWGI